MFFKELYFARDLELDLINCSPVKFIYVFPLPPMTITLRRPTQKEEAGWRQDDVLCDVSCEREPTKKARLVFESLSEGKVPEGYDPRFISPGTLDSEGKIKHIGMLSMSSMPAAFKSFSETLWGEMRDQTAKTISVLRWRLNRPQGPNPISRMLFGDGFSFDGDTWTMFPSRFDSMAVDIHTARVSEALVSEITSLIASSVDEPLPHVLFRESWSLKDGNPRSSLLIGVAAAEIAMKRYVSLMVPNSEWLVKNLPSPPLERLASDYFPILPSKGSLQGEKKVPQRILEELKKAVQVRNEISHKGEYKLSRDSLERKLVAIRDFLWLLDYHSGYEWAIVHMSE